MGIKYGFCSDVKSRRINLGRTTLVCGSNAYVYSTDLTGTVTQSDIGAMSLDDIDSLLCLEDSSGDCGGGLTGSFFAQSASYNATVQNNPMMIGCCADHIAHEGGYLINTAVGGVTTSREHVISVNGQGEPWAVSSADVITALTTAGEALSVLNIPPPPGGAYVPTSVDSNLPGDSWQQGSASWTQFEGLGDDMVTDSDLIYSDVDEYTLSVNTTTGRVDGSISKGAYYTVGEGNIPCVPVLAQAKLCEFATQLNAIPIGDS